METENIPETNGVYKKIIFILLLMFNLTIISAICLIIIINGKNEYFFKAIIVIMTITLLGIGFLLLGIIFTIALIWYEFPIPRVYERLLGLSFTIIYPGIFFLGKLVGYNKNTIRNIFIELNNKLVSINKYSIEGNDILILIPHCIQNTFCPYRITVNVENCKHCGKCNVGDLIRLREEFGVNIKVVTGGTLARKTVKSLKPKAIIAIACERDLINGLHDVRNLPIIAITNKRPEGPCVNTSVNIDKVRMAVKHFLYEE